MPYLPRLTSLIGVACTLPLLIPGSEGPDSGRCQSGTCDQNDHCVGRYLPPKPNLSTSQREDAVYTESTNRRLDPSRIGYCLGVKAFGQKNNQTGVRCENGGVYDLQADIFADDHRPTDYEREGGCR